MERGYFTINEIMERYGIGSNAVRNAIRNGTIPALKFGKRYVVPREALEAMERRIGMESAGRVNHEEKNKLSG